MTRYFNKIILSVSILIIHALANTDGALILERANSNENIYSSATGEFISHLRGNVVFRYDDMRIRADEATWQKNIGIVDFRNNVRVDHRGQVMTCERLHFVRDNNRLSARGSVNYIDSAQITRIEGTDAEYRTDTKVLMLWGSPVLTRADKSDTDTLYIRSRIMTYNDSTKIVTASDAVNIIRGDLTATCRKVDYFIDADIAKMRIRPVINYESHKIVGDSIDLLFAGEALKGARVMGRAHGYHTETADSATDTTVTNIWSDSLHLTMFDNGKMESMKAFRNARATRAESPRRPGGKSTDMKLSSDSLHLFMYEETGKLRAVKAFGRARCDYAEATPDSGGSRMTATVTGDSLRASMFETGKLRSMAAYGKARCDYAESSPENGGKTTATVTGDSLRAFTFESGNIRAMTAYGNKANGFYTEIPADTAAGGTMTANITGDSLRAFMFETGKLRGMKAYGGVRAVYAETFASGATTSMDITSDSMRVAMRETGKVRTMRAYGNTQVRSAEWSTSASDSMITRIWSDSLRVQMSETGKVSTMKAFVNVRSLNFMLSDSARANDITGQTMTIAFDDHGRINQALVRGGAESRYYLDESEGGGFNKAAGEVIHIAFTRGKPQRLKVRGNVKGLYVP